MALKIAGSGLQYKHLQCVYDRNGLDGISAVFRTKGRKDNPRVTNYKRIISSLYDYFDGVKK